MALTQERMSNKPSHSFMHPIKQTLYAGILRREEKDLINEFNYAHQS